MPEPVAQPAWSGLPRAPSLRQLVDPSLWDHLVQGRSTVHAPAGALLQAPESSHVLAIVTGTARLFIGAAGGRQLTLRYARAGDVVGLGAALSRGIAPSAEAVSGTTAAVLSLEELRVMSGDHPELVWAIATQVAGWASDVVLAAVHLEHRPVTARIAGHLLELATTTLGGTDQAQISHRGLAEVAGTVREVVSRHLRELREAHVVETPPGKVVITDRHRLARIARGDDVLP